MSRYNTSLHIPMATNLSAFRAINEGANLRDAIKDVAEEFESHSKGILKGLLDDPKVKELADQLNGEHKEAHVEQKTDGEHKEHGEHTEQKQHVEGEEHANEELVSSLILSAPVIIQGVGKVMKFLGKKFGKEEENALVKMGEVIDHAGHGLHEWYLKKITQLLGLVFRKKDEKERAIMAKTIFMVMLAFKVYGGATSLVEIIAHPKSAMLAVEAGLTSIKAGEILTVMKSAIPALLAKVGIGGSE